MTLTDRADAPPAGLAGAASPGPEALAGALATLWSRHRASNIDRVTRLESAAAATLRDALDGATRDAAEQAAHKLAGSLGTFGLAVGTDLARRVETMLRESRPDPYALAEAVVALRAAIEVGPPGAAVVAGPPGAAAAGDNGPHAGPTTPQRARRALVVTPDTALADGLRVRLAALGWTPLAVPDATAAIATLARSGSDSTATAIAVVDVAAEDMARGVPTALADLAAIAPTVVLTRCDALADGARLGSARLAAARAGIVGFMARTDPVDSIAAFATAAARSRGPRPVTVLALRADPHFDDLYGEAPPECRVVPVTDRSNWWHALESNRPDVVIVEVEPARTHRLGRPWRGGSGVRDAGRHSGVQTDSQVDGTPVGALEVCRVLRGAPRWSSIPIVVLDSGARRHGDAAPVAAAIAAGADDLISGPVDAAGLYALIRARLARADTLLPAHPGELALRALLAPTVSQPTVSQPATPQPAAVDPAVAPLDTGAFETRSGSIADTAPDVEVSGYTTDVVLVEDDDSVADVVEYALRLRNLRPYRITNGADAVSLLCGGPVRARLILLDVGLPGLDGFAVLGRLREAGALSRTPVIMLTARSSETETLAALGLGAAEHIAKPFSVPILINRIEHALRRSGQ